MDMSESRNLTVIPATDKFALVPRTMIFFSEDRLPEKVGKAELSFYSGISFPQREGKFIKLPSRQGQMVFHSLRGGNQFLIEVSGRNYFGGTDNDESILLSEVNGVTLSAFADAG